MAETKLQFAPYTGVDWQPLERAIQLAGRPASDLDEFMWMCESPAGFHQYKQSHTRNYAFLRGDSSPEECITQLRTAFCMECTWVRRCAACAWNDYEISETATEVAHA